MTSLPRTVGRSLIALVGAAMLALVLSPAPAGAVQDHTEAESQVDSDSLPQVSVTGSVRVGSNDRVDRDVVSVDGSVRVDGVVDGSVFVARGDVTVGGRVTGSVVVLNGDVTVSGTVGDDVTVFMGRATINDGARVKGDVSSSDKPSVAKGATVGGSVDEISLTGLLSVIGWFMLALWWLAVTFSLVILGIILILVFPRAAAMLAAAGRSSVGKNVGWGALVGLVLPILAIGISITILGLPLGMGTLAALTVAYPIGYLVTALVIGRLMLPRQHALVAFLLGFAVLRAGAVLPGLGFLIGFLAALYGLGILAVSAWRAGRDAPSADDVPDSSSPPAPAPSAPTTNA